MARFLAILATTALIVAVLAIILSCGEWGPQGVVVVAIALVVLVGATFWEAMR